MRILVVEDDPDLARQLAGALENAGYAVDIANDGEGLSALFFDVFGDCFNFAYCAGTADNLGTKFSESFRCGGPNTASGSGDNSYALIEGQGLTRTFCSPKL